MDARTINKVAAVIIGCALAVNALGTCEGWALVGDLFGWALLVAGLWKVIDNKLKERNEL